MKKIYLIIENTGHFEDTPLMAHSTIEGAFATIEKLKEEHREDGCSYGVSYREIDFFEDKG